MPYQVSHHLNCILCPHKFSANLNMQSTFQCCSLHTKYVVTSHIFSKLGKANRDFIIFKVSPCCFIVNTVSTFLVIFPLRTVLNTSKSYKVKVGYTEPTTDVKRYIFLFPIFTGCSNYLSYLLQKCRHLQRVPEKAGPEIYQQIWRYIAELPT